MSAIRASVRAVEEAEAFLRGLASSRQAFGLYHPGHPGRTEAVADLVTRSERLREALGRDPVLFATRRSFYLGATLLPWASLTLRKLAEAFESAEVASLEMYPGVADPDMDALIRLLAGEREAQAQLERITVNRAGTTPPEEDEEGGMGELLGSYAAGLELLRDAAARLLAGRPADLEATRRLTENLADQIAVDPAQALLLTTVKSYDEYTFHHMVNVCVLSIALGQMLGLSREHVVALGMGGLLHDVGKVKIPQEILNERGPLTPEQWRSVQRHPVEGTALVFTTSRDLLHPSASVVLEHHVRFDTAGYPGLRPRRPPSLAARLVAVTDCFDAVTSERSYRRAEERRQALSIIQAGAGTGFDPRVVRAFVRLLGLFPVGSLVKLSEGEVGVVVRNHERLLARPVVKLILDASGSECEPEEVDLSEQGPGEDYRMHVVRSIDPAELGIDMLNLIASGRLQPQPPDAGPGLVHEPSPGEEPPPGYVDDHPEPPEVRLDPDALPPFPT